MTRWGGQQEMTQAKISVSSPLGSLRKTWHSSCVWWPGLRSKQSSSRVPRHRMAQGTTGKGIHRSASWVLPGSRKRERDQQLSSCMEGIRKACVLGRILMDGKWNVNDSKTSPKIVQAKWKHVWISRGSWACSSARPGLSTSPVGEEKKTFPSPSALQLQPYELDWPNKDWQEKNRVC